MGRSTRTHRRTRRRVAADGARARRPGPLLRGTSQRGLPAAPMGERASEFEIFTGLTVDITDDVRGAIDACKPLTGMYVGGMGSKTHNYHREAMARRGFPEAAQRIHELWMAGKKEEAIAAVPDEYIEQGSLLGSPQRIRDRWPESPASVAQPAGSCAATPSKNSSWRLSWGAPATG